MARVDVLVPVRDSVDTLTEALESIRAQTLEDWRALVVDDGSHDGSGDSARASAAQDSRIVVIAEEARGLVSALHAGLERANAPFLARLDADDAMAPDRLALQVEALENDDTLTVVSSRVEFFGDEVSPNLRRYEAWLNGLVDHEAITRDLFVEAPLPHPSVTMRTEALRAIGGYRDGGFPEDYDLWLRGWLSGWRFAKREETLTRIRDHGGRLTKTDPRYTTRAFLECKVGHAVEAFGLGGRDVVVWGAGRDGKRAAKALRRRGVSIAHLVDIAPTKLGRRMMGLDVRPPESLESAGNAFVVAAVGIAGARAEIRAALDATGRTELGDYVCFG